MAKSKLPKVGDVVISEKIGKGEYVVETAAYSGGGTGSGAGGSYSVPDGWHVKVRRLNQDGTFNQKGRTKSFYMSRGFCDYIDPKDVQIVRKMTFTFS
jgi:hypothetical protein